MGICSLDVMVRTLALLRLFSVLKKFR